MASYRYLILFSALLLNACAVVGDITGGPKDIYAPKPLSHKSSPENGSTNFTGKSVELTFDEFFRLNEPNLTIRMVPSHAFIQSTVKGKTLTMSWEEDLQPNTTYGIYLNNAVKDITESNDTIIQFAFSTGPELDTLTYKAGVVDAWTDKPVQNCIIGLFDPLTNELLNFSETDKAGIASLSYLQARSYVLRAFMDQNGDLEIQDHEKVGFKRDSLITISDFTVDSIPMRLYTPKTEAEISSANLVSPGAVYVGLSSTITNASVFLNGKEVEGRQLKYIEKDSLCIYADLRDTNYVQLVVHSDEIRDTSSFRFFNRKIPAISLAPKTPSRTYSPWDDVVFTCNDFIETIDTSLITVLRKLDSVVISDYTFSSSYNELSFSFSDTAHREAYIILFEEGAIEATHGKLKRTETTITLEPKRKFGTLNVDLSYYASTDIVLLVNKGNNVVKKLPIEKETGQISIDGLYPGAYSFMVIVDENGNGLWDVGELSTRKQPESVKHYSTPVNVRANWEVDISLSE